MLWPALWRGPQMCPAIEHLIPAKTPWMSLETDSARARLWDDYSPSWHDSLMQSLEGPWARGSQLHHPWIPDPKKLWGNKCLLFQPTRFWGNLFCSIDNKYKAFFIYVGYRLFVIYMYYKYLPPLLALLLIIDSFDKGKFLIFHVFPFIMFFFYDECRCVLFKKT